MPKLTSVDKSVRVRVVLITLDSHLASTVARAHKSLKKTLPNFELNAHVATDWNRNPASLECCLDDIENGDIHEFGEVRVCPLCGTTITDRMRLLA